MNNLIWTEIKFLKKGVWGENKKWQIRTHGSRRTRPTNRQIDRHTERQTLRDRRQIDRQWDSQTDIEKDKHTDIHI